MVELIMDDVTREDVVAYEFEKIEKLYTMVIIISVALIIISGVIL